MTATAPTDSPPARRQGGPPLGVLAGVSLLLLLTGIASSAALGGVFPSPFAESGVLAHYFATYPDAVLISGFFAFASAVPLSIYAATASSRLRTLGVTAPGATIALAGGLVASAMLALSGLLQWVLSRPEVRTVLPLARALQDFSFLTGGVAHVVFLGLLLAGIAVPALLLRLVPAPLALTGLVIAAVAELATLSLLWPSASVLLPIGRFAGLLWLIIVGMLLPHRRARRNLPRTGQVPS